MDPWKKETVTQGDVTYDIYTLELAAPLIIRVVQHDEKPELFEAELTARGAVNGNEYYGDSLISIYGIVGLDNCKRHIVGLAKAMMNVSMSILNG